MTYWFSSKAEQDINSIWLYTVDRWSMEQADRYHHILIAGVQHLTENPELGRIYSNRDGTFKFFQIMSHLIFYRETSSTEIEIVRILHKSMDIENRLRD